MFFAFLISLFFKERLGEIFKHGWLSLHLTYFFKKGNHISTKDNHCTQAKFAEI